MGESVGKPRFPRFWPALVDNGKAMSSPRPTPRADPLSRFVHRIGAVAVALVLMLVIGVSQAAAVVPAVSLFAPGVARTAGTSASFNLSFNTAVTGLTAGDFTVGGTATGWTVSGVSGSGSAYTVALDGATGSEGTVVVTLAANSVVDSLNTPGPTASRDASTMTVDRTSPTITSVTSPSGVQSTTTLTFIVSFNEVWWYTVVALFFGSGPVRRFYLKAKVWIDRITGLFLGGLGLRLLWSAREVL